jgi:N-acetylneuraminic acid mutarotase
MTSKPVLALLVIIGLLMGLLVLYASAQGPVNSTARQMTEASPASPAAIDAAIEPVEAGIACAPATLVYEVEVRNDDTVPDTIDISALADNFWPVAVEPASLTLEPGTTGIANVTVEIPWYATAGDTQALVVTADPQLGDPVTETVQTTAALGANWEDLASSPRGGPGAAVVYENGSLYQIGGYGSEGPHDGTYRYDPAGNTWETMTDMITPTAYMDGAAIGGNIYVPGGETAASDWNAFVQVYSTTADIWDTVAPMPVPVRHHEVVARSGRLYVLGGQTSGGVYTDTVQMYNPATDSWSEREPMTIPVAYAASGVIGGKIYLAGGFNDTGYQSALQIYDPVADSWSYGTDLPSAWVQAADGVKHDRYLILAGGHASDLETTSAKGWFYDADNDAWFPLPDANSSRFGAEGGGDGSQFYYLGGAEEGTTPIYSVRNERLVQCPAPKAQARVEAGTLSAPGCPDRTETLSFEVCNDGNAPLQFNIQEAPRNPTAVDWNRPSGTPPHGYANQDFEPVRDAYDIFIADDFVNNEWWAIDTIYVPGRYLLSGGDLTCATLLHWEIYADDGGAPAGNPGGTGALPVWAYYGASSDPNLIFTEGGDPHLTDVELNLNLPVTLPPGHWWMVFYPSMSLSDCFQYGRETTDMISESPAQVINPGGARGFGTAWTQASTVFGSFAQAFAFRLEGATLGDIPWLSEDPPTGAVEGGQCTSVEVLFDATGLAPGTYDAGLTVGSSDSGTQSSNLPVSLVVREPAAIQDVSYVVDQRQVTFDATVTGTAPLAYDWHFGDGASSTLEDPVHDYDTYQCYQVTLNVTNACAEDVWPMKLCLAKPTVYLPVVAKNP